MNVCLSKKSLYPLSSLASARRKAAGYSLVELLISLLILALVLIGLLNVFDSSNQIARAQTELSEVQQALRIGQQEIVGMLRMTGAGGLPISYHHIPTDVSVLNGTISYDSPGAFPANGLAVAIDNNVDSETFLPVTPSAGVEQHEVLEGSDVLTLRGVFTTPVYYLPLLSAVDTSETMTFEVPDRVNSVIRPLEPLIRRIDEAVADGIPLAVILRDLESPDSYVVMRLNPGGTNTTPATCSSGAGEEVIHGAAQCITVSVTHDAAGDSEHAQAFGDLTIGTRLIDGYSTVDRWDLPGAAKLADLPVPSRVSSFGILEEFKYYVRGEWDSDDPTYRQRLTPVLTRAEFVPGTDTLIDRVDLTENIIGMQVTVGVESDGIEVRESIFDAGDDSDEVLFNSPDDMDAGPPGALSALSNTDDASPWYHPDLLYRFVRVTLVAQGQVVDRSQNIPQLGFIEDSDMGGTVTVDGEEYSFATESSFRRRVLSTSVKMRNAQ